MPAPKFEVVPDWLDGATSAGALPDIADVAVGSDDVVYLLARGPGRIVALTPEGELVLVMGEGVLSERPHGLSLCPDGRLFCVDEKRHAIAVFGADGTFERWIGTPDVPSDTGAGTGAGDLPSRLRAIRGTAGPFNLPTHAMFTADGEMLVTDGYGNAAVHRMTLDGTLIETWGSPGEGPGQFRVPHYDCPIDGEHFAVCDRENGRVQVFDRSGALQAIWPSQRPSGIARDPSNDLFYVSEIGIDAGSDLFARGIVASAESPRVTVWTASGTQVDEIVSATDDPSDPGSFIVPHGIAIDTQGSLYVAETTTTYRRARDAGQGTGRLTCFGASIECGPTPEICHSLQKFTPSRT